MVRTRACSSVVERHSYKVEVPGSTPGMPTRALGAVVSASGRHPEGHRFKSCSAHMKLKVLYEDENILVIDKPAGIIVYSEKPKKQKTLIDFVLEKYPSFKKGLFPPRYGIIHRLDRDTSGLLVVAKDNKSLKFLQQKFKRGEVEKKYHVLVVGTLKTNEGIIENLIGRSIKDRRKQRVYFPNEPEVKRKKLRKASTKYKVLKRFKGYTLVIASPKTGRKHQIRTQFSYLGHPIAGDKLYGFKRQPCPEGLYRQFLHASFLKVKLPGGEVKEFYSKIPDDLEKVLKNLT